MTLYIDYLTFRKGGEGEKILYKRKKKRGEKAQARI